MDSNGTAGEMTAVMNLQPGDVAHIESHAWRGEQISCGSHNIAVTGTHWTDSSHAGVVVDYDPWALYPGDLGSRHGTVVYDRLARVAVLWHGLGAA